MRAIWIATAAALLAAPLFADDKQDRERRVRVALALAGTDTPTPAVAAADCGRCREDVDAARLDGLKEGKPIVLFVGGCPGDQVAGAVYGAGGIPVKAPTYTGDDRPPAEKRVVILEPKADRSGFVRTSLPVSTPAKELRERVKASVPAKVAPLPPTHPPAPLNWNF